MKLCVGWFELTIYLFAGAVFQLRNANAIPLVKFQEDSVNTSTTVLPEIFSPTVETRKSEETFSPTVVQPASEEPPCWKKLKEITEFLEMFDFPPADFSPPDCDSKGYYKPLQCHFGGCQCVDRRGKPTSKLEEFGLVCLQTEPQFVFADLPLQ